MNRNLGYLVVLKTSYESDISLNKRYRGIDRLPPYPTDIVEEKDALKQYVFGDYKNEDGFIEEISNAHELEEKFDISNREYEIIFCISKLDKSINKENDFSGKLLGYDIADCKTPFWSSLNDYPTDKYMSKYLSELNESGLFDSIENAMEYLKDYIELKLPNYDLRSLGLIGIYVIRRD